MKSDMLERNIDDVIKLAKEKNRKVDAKKITKAYNYACEKHGDQKRRSGEPYIIHPLQVAYTLAGLEKVMMCVGYKFNDEIIDYFPASLEDLAKCEPIYEEFDGWDESVAEARSYEELHPNARKYLERIEELTDTRISIVSVGPRRDQTMRVKPL